MSAMEISNLTIIALKQMFESGRRFDGRGLFDYRELSAELDVSNKAEGSARVRLGKTEVVAGIKMAVGEPYPDSPDKGNLTVSGDLLPLASPRFEMGPPDFYAIELPRLVDRAVRESGMLDLSKLVIEEGKKVWTIYIDIYPINDDGNLIDAATMAAIIALKNAVMPTIDKEGKVDYEAKSDKKLPVSKETHPFSVTFYKLGKSIILDPSREEAEACDVRITFGISFWNKHYMLNSSQKSGAVPFTQEEMEKMMEILPKKYDELNEKLKKYF